MDATLPFGLRYAPKIFHAVADALKLIVRRQGVRYVDHYLNDFILYGPHNSDICATQLRVTINMCRLGVPPATEKLERPTDRLTFLGIEVDTKAGILRLPRDKLARTKVALRAWETRKCCTKWELESLIGTLQHACKDIRHGRAFLRRMIDLAKVPRRFHHFTRLNNEFRADLRWWHVFIEHWNGIAIIPVPTTVNVVVTSDASGLWGCGAWCQLQWFQYQWLEACAQHISFKELFALLVAMATWGRHWTHKQVLWRCDNQAAVRVIFDQVMLSPPPR